MLKEMCGGAKDDGGLMVCTTFHNQTKLVHLVIILSLHGDCLVMCSCDSEKGSNMYVCVVVKKKFKLKSLSVYFEPVCLAMKLWFPAGISIFMQRGPFSFRSTCLSIFFFPFTFIVMNPYSGRSAVHPVLISLKFGGFRWMLLLLLMVLPFLLLLLMIQPHGSEFYTRTHTAKWDYAKTI